MASWFGPLPNVVSRLVVCGSHRRGPNSWKSKAGKTLGEIEAEVAAVSADAFDSVETVYLPEAAA